MNIARRQNIELKSFVFPRSQFSRAYVDILGRWGVKVLRGTEESWLYRPSPKSGHLTFRRGARLADQYVNLSGHHSQSPVPVGQLINLPSSLFFRRATGKLTMLDQLQLRRIKASMTAAAQSNKVYHIWWHPQDFGFDVEASMAFLEQVILHYSRLNDEYGMTSANMADFSSESSSPLSSALDASPSGSVLQ